MNKTIIVEKEKKFDSESLNLQKDLKDFLNIKNLVSVKILDAFNISNIDDEIYEKLKKELFSTKDTKNIYKSIPKLENNELAFRIQQKNGQYNQKEDMANEYIQKIFGYENLFIKHSKILILEGINEKDLEKIKKYYINAVDSKEIPLDDSSVFTYGDCEYKYEEVNDFINMTNLKLKELIKDFAMDFQDIKLVQKYFIKENRNPNIWELKIIDTYWSDHCRHTTFLTEIKNMEFVEGKYKNIIKNTYKEYLESRKYVHNNKKPITLMDMATINMKELKKQGLLEDMEISEEINACSIKVKVDVNNKDEDWLLLFKNETHNHPTEIEPYGGANTCIGGGIRDPLSSRAFVYQAMRITGAKDPRGNYEDKLKNKLSQREICQKSLKGYSDYSNQIGLASGLVKEFYHNGYEAKRMELGALVAAAPEDWVKRQEPIPTDLIVLIGARTGRDGLGAAVGSSNIQNENSLETGGAEVQKGNPLAERNIIRLFRNPKATKLIKRCNDFGAGGVAVAIGELADGLEINLDNVLLKYKGLSGGEIALSESQERMAVVISKENLEEFLDLSKKENIEATVVAKVIEEKRMKMTWRNNEIINISRELLNSNGGNKEVNSKIIGPDNLDYLFLNKRKTDKNNIETIKDLMNSVNYCSQKGMVENFDNSIGTGTVLSFLGGKNKITPQEGIVGKIPVLNKKTKSCSIMTYGYDPYLAEISQFHGGYYAVIESVAKIVALGGDYSKVRLSFQEFFERLDYNEEKWSKPITALLGAYKAMKDLKIPSIGGKDSMSGTYENINVPPTLVSFAVLKENIKNIVSRELKENNSTLILVEIPILENGLLNIEILKKKYEEIKKLVNERKILSMSTVNSGGIGKSISEMALGNSIGVKLHENINEKLFKNLYGSLILEIKNEDISYFKEIGEIIGNTNSENNININDEILDLNELYKIYTSPLEEIYPIRKTVETVDEFNFPYSLSNYRKNIKEKPTVLIPVFPGTNGEYDLENKFTKENANVKKIVFNFLTKENIENSLGKLAKEIDNSNILVLANGAIMGEEIGDNGKLIELILKNRNIKKSVENLIENRNGLIIGLGAGFTGLVNSGLIEFGKVKEGSSIKIVKNENDSFLSDLIDFKVVNNNSPWLWKMDVNDIYTAPVATKQGKLILGEAKEKLIENNQIVTIYNNDNITNSELNIDGLISPCGKIIGLTGLIDRIDEDLFINNQVNGLSKIIESGISYFS